MRLAIVVAVLALAACQRPTDERVHAAASACGEMNEPGSQDFYWCLTNLAETDEFDCRDWYGNECEAWGREGAKQARAREVLSRRQREHESLR